MLKSVIITLTIAIFAFISLGDVFMQSADKGQWIVQVGPKKYYLDDYREFLHDLRNNLPPKSQISDEELKNEALEKLIEAALLESEAAAIGLTVSDKTVQQEIASISFFKDGRGFFSKEKFDTFIRNNHLNPKVFIDRIKRYYMRKQLMQIFNLNRNAVYRPMLEAITKVIYDNRSVEVLLVKQDDLLNLQPPGSTELEQFFQQNPHLFMTPEIRSVEYAVLGIDSLKNAATRSEISESELKSEYDKQVSQLVLPETRDVEQMICTDEEVAMMAYNKMQAKEDFHRIRAKYETPNAYSHAITGIAKGDYLDKQLEKIIFALKDGEISQPYQTALGWHIFKIKKIHPSRRESYREARSKILQEVLMLRNQDRLSQLAQDVDRDIKSQISISELAKKYSLKLVTADVSILAASDTDTETLNDSPASATKAILSRVAAATSLGSISELEPFTPSPSPQLASANSDLSGESYLLLAVKAISPAKVEKPSASGIKQKWLAANGQALSDRLAADLRRYWLIKQGNTSDHQKTAVTGLDLDALNPNHTALYDMAIHKRQKLQISRVQHLPEVMPLDAAAKVFDGTVGETLAPHYDESGRRYIITRIADVSYLDAAETRQYTTQFHEQISNFYFDMLADEYIAYLKKKYTPVVRKEIIQSSGL